MSKGWPPPNDPTTNGICGTFVFVDPKPGECKCGGEVVPVLVAMQPVWTCCPSLLLFYQCYMQNQLFCYACPHGCQGDYIV